MKIQSPSGAIFSLGFNHLYFLITFSNKDVLANKCLLLGVYTHSVRSQKFPVCSKLQVGEWSINLRLAVSQGLPEENRGLSRKKGPALRRIGGELLHIESTGTSDSEDEQVGLKHGEDGSEPMLKLHISMCFVNLVPGRKGESPGARWQASIA